MSKKVITSLAGALALALTASGAHADCKTLGAIGTGINEGIAKYMGEAALKNIATNQGMKPTGPITYKCEAGMVSTDCHAKQKACK